MPRNNLCGQIRGLISGELSFDTRIILHAGILDSSKDDFEDGDEVYEAIGQVLHEVEDKSENEVRSVNVFAFVILITNSITRVTLD